MGRYRFLRGSFVEKYGVQTMAQKRKGEAIAFSIPLELMIRN